MSTHVQLTGHDLRALIRSIRILDSGPSIYSLRIEMRKDGLAYKINEGMWSPTVGNVVDNNASNVVTKDGPSGDA